MDKNRISKIPLETFYPRTSLYYLSTDAYAWKDPAGAKLRPTSVNYTQTDRPSAKFTL